MPTQQAVLNAQAPTPSPGADQQLSVIELLLKRVQAGRTLSAASFDGRRQGSILTTLDLAIRISETVWLPIHPDPDHPASAELVNGSCLPAGVYMQRLVVGAKDLRTDPQGATFKKVHYRATRYIVVGQPSSPVPEPVCVDADGNACIPPAQLRNITLPLLSPKHMKAARDRFIREGELAYESIVRDHAIPLLRAWERQGVNRQPSSVDAADRVAEGLEALTKTVDKFVSFHDRPAANFIFALNSRAKRDIQRASNRGLGISMEDAHFLTWVSNFPDPNAPIDTIAQAYLDDPVRAQNRKRYSSVDRKTVGVDDRLRVKISNAMRVTEALRRRSLDQPQGEDGESLAAFHGQDDTALQSVTEELDIAEFARMWFTGSGIDSPQQQMSVMNLLASNLGSGRKKLRPAAFTTPDGIAAAHALRPLLFKGESLDDQATVDALCERFKELVFGGLTTGTPRPRSEVEIAARWQTVLSDPERQDRPSATPNYFDL